MKSQLIKLLSVILLSILVFSGCGPKNNSKTPENQNSSDAISKAADTKAISSAKPLTIATSFYPMYILALNVAKDVPNVKVVDLTKPITGCLHDYAVTPDDMKKLEEAQVFIVNGAGMESFMDKVIKQIPNLKIVDSGIGIQLIKGQGDQGDNPHLWVSISNAITQVKNMGDQLANFDKDNAAKYKENTDVYVKKLEAEREKMHKALDGIKNRDIITFHEAFPYFAKEFNLNIVGVIEREPGSEPSAKELIDSINKIKELKVKALFVEPQYPAKSAETIAKETGAKVYTLDPIVTGPMDADAYISIMDNNLKTLQEALK